MHGIDIDTGIGIDIGFDIDTGSGTGIDTGIGSASAARRAWRRRTARNESMPRCSSGFARLARSIGKPTDAAAASTAASVALAAVPA